MTFLEKYRLLAFCVCHKMRKRSGMVHSLEKKYKVADNLKMSVNTYSKYFKICIEMGLLIKLGSSYQFIKLSRIIELLGLDLREWKYCRFFRGISQELSFKGVYDRIRFSIAERNYKQQEFKIRRSRIKEVRAPQKRCPNYNSVHKDNKFIVSGKKHVSDLLGCCQATGLRLLRKWNGVFMKRKVITRFFDIHVSDESYDLLKRSGFRPLMYKGKWAHTLGSRVELL